jgi:hypothetical protein
MVTIRGVYDGNAIRPLPAETLPEVKGEVPVLITFVETNIENEREVVRRLRAAREAMLPLDVSIPELIKEMR